MGTRGSLGVKTEGKYYLTYNQCDSYPEGLGQDVVDFVNELTEEKAQKLRKGFKGLTIVDSQDNPKGKWKTYYASSHENVDTGENWYAYLRGFQGIETLKGVLTGVLKHIILTNDFIQDSLFCEYAYIINLDDNTLEFYEGFQHIPQENNPFGTEGKPTNFYENVVYYPCKLVGKVKLFERVPEDWITQFYPREE